MNKSVMSRQIANLSEARINMIKQQCRTWDILDPKILELLSQTPRDAFVPTAFQQLAYADTCLPIGHDQHMWVPKEEARILDKLQVHENERVWEIGTGSGYLTALLAKRAKHVDSMEIFEDFIQTAAQKLQQQHIYNVSLELGDGIAGLKNRKIDYDVIVLTGSLKALPKLFLSRLNLKGRLLAFIGTPPCIQAVLITKTSEQTVHTEILFETVVDPLITELHENNEKFVF